MQLHVAGRSQLVVEDSIRVAHARAHQSRSLQYPTSPATVVIPNEHVIGQAHIDSSDETDSKRLSCDLDSMLQCLLSLTGIRFEAQDPAISSCDGH